MGAGGGSAGRLGGGGVGRVGGGGIGGKGGASGSQGRGGMSCAAVEGGWGREASAAVSRPDAAGCEGGAAPDGPAALAAAKDLCGDACGECWAGALLSRHKTHARAGVGT